ncbi:MAG: ribokinase [Firmicutes bacterium]|nr:ribokinase [Bacillota bacterium]
MRILDFGSINYDDFYRVDHIVQPGETISVLEITHSYGGKGLNQAVALARAGLPVRFAGMIGEDGDELLDYCSSQGVDTGLVHRCTGRTGSTIIQVDKNAENCILLHGGANRRITQGMIDEVLDHFEAGDYLLLQNEISELPYLIDCAHAKGMRIILNPSPCDERLADCDLGKISLFMINEVEGAQMTGEQEPERMLDTMAKRYPDAAIVLTLGEDGAVYTDGRERIFQPAYQVPVVDTTAAGDTFTGYFIAGVINGMTVRDTMRLAARAASITVGRAGAALSIPTMEEVRALCGDCF